MGRPQIVARPPQTVAQQPQTVANPSPLRNTQSAASTAPTTTFAQTMTDEQNYSTDVAQDTMAVGLLNDLSKIMGKKYGNGAITLDEYMSAYPDKFITDTGVFKMAPTNNDSPTFSPTS